MGGSDILCHMEHRIAAPRWHGDSEWHNRPTCLCDNLCIREAGYPSLLSRDMLGRPDLDQPDDFRFTSHRADPAAEALIGVHMRLNRVSPARWSSLSRATGTSTSRSGGRCRLCRAPRPRICSWPQFSPTPRTSQADGRRCSSGCSSWRWR